MNPATNLESLQFDQYQRYRNAADLIRTFRGPGQNFSVLEIGAGPGGLLEAFSPQDRVHYLDKELPPGRGGDANFIHADILRNGLPTAAYDITLALDVFEHIAPPDRALFLQELTRLSRKMVILCAPFATAGVEEAEVRVNDHYRLLAGRDFSWLCEHREHGLPDLGETARTLAGQGLGVLSFGHGNLKVWEDTMRTLLFIHHHGNQPRFLDAVNGFYNHCIHPVDRTPPCYRHFLVAVRDCEPARARLQGFIEGPGSRGGGINNGAELTLHRLPSVYHSTFAEERWRDMLSHHLEELHGALSIVSRHLAGGEAVERLTRENEQLRTEVERMRTEMGRSRAAQSQAEDRAGMAENTIRHLQLHLDQTRALADSLRLSRRLTRHMRGLGRLCEFALWSSRQLLDPRASPQTARKVLEVLQNQGMKGLLRKSREKFTQQDLPAAAPGLPARQREHLYTSYTRHNAISPPARELLIEAMKTFRRRPLISVLMPVYNVEPRWLNKAIGSVLAQIYDNFELCIADDASTREDTRAALRRYEGHPRVKIAWRERNGHICEASNSAASLASGEMLAFMDNDDVLEENALFEVAGLLEEHPETDLIYSDEDKIDVEDLRYDPQFKPDWSPELFLSYNYVNHFTCLRRGIFETVGGFRKGFEGAQDYDLLLRVVEKTDRIRHIPKVLYHWRAVLGSTARDARDKPVMSRSALRGLEEHLRRRDLAARIYKPRFAESLGLPLHLLDWPDEGPSVAIIIPTHNQQRLLKACIESILRLTTYRNYSILVVDNDSDEPASLKYLADLPQQGVRVERISNEGRPFSFSRINNLAVARVDAEFVLFLNNDIEVREGRWLSRMAGYLSLPGVGVTGARLLFPSGALQHAGVIMCMHGGVVPDHAFLHQDGAAVSYYFMAESARDCSAVTGACLLTRRNDFMAAGGFDEETFRVSLQDVDYCLKLAAHNLRTVYVAGAELLHHQSATRAAEDDPGELAGLRRKHATSVDPYYNPNLSREVSYHSGTDCIHTDWRRYLRRPLKALIFSHNMELAGAPKAMADLARGLKNLKDEYAVEFISPAEGSLKRYLDRDAITWRTLDLGTRNIAAGWRSRENYEITKRTLLNFITEQQPGVVIANTLYGFCAVKAAKAAGVPALWVISESLRPEDLGRVLEPFAAEDCLRAFSSAYAVIFGSRGTRAGYEALNARNNFHVIHNGLEHALINEFRTACDAGHARTHVGADAQRTLFLMVGTICERKNQAVIVEAAKILARKRRDFACHLVGANELVAGPYLQRIRADVATAGLEDVVKLIPDTEELFWHYRSADVFFFSSTSECYPLATLEAMGFGLPIITTPCLGVTEQVRSVNALFFEPRDAAALAGHMERLLADNELRQRMGRNSRSIFEYLPTFEEMVSRFRDLTVAAWLNRPA